MKSIPLLLLSLSVPLCLGGQIYAGFQVGRTSPLQFPGVASEIADSRLGVTEGLTLDFPLPWRSRFGETRLFVSGDVIDFVVDHENIRFAFRNVDNWPSVSSELTDIQLQAAILFEVKSATISIWPNNKFSFWTGPGLIYAPFGPKHDPNCMLFLPSEQVCPLSNPAVYAHYSHGRFFNIDPSILFRITSQREFWGGNLTLRSALTYDFHPLTITEINTVIRHDITPFDGEATFNRSSLKLNFQFSLQPGSLKSWRKRNRDRFINETT